MFTSENNKINVSEISLPKGGGAIKGIGDTFSPNSFTGTGSFSIQFLVTKVRNLIFSVYYNSRLGNSTLGFIHFNFITIIDNLEFN